MAGREVLRLLLPDQLVQVAEAVGVLVEVLLFPELDLAVLAVKPLTLMVKLLHGLVGIQLGFMGASHDTYRKIFKVAKCLC
jgi:hypothetical protein